MMELACFRLFTGLTQSTFYMVTLNNRSTNINLPFRCFEKKDLFLASCSPRLLERRILLFVVDQAMEEAIHECTILSLINYSNFAIFLSPILFDRQVVTSQSLVTSIFFLNSELKCCVL